MAAIYVRNAGSNTSPYDTWAKAATTLATAVGAATSADTIYVADDHSESTVGAVTITCPSSEGLRILCVNTHVTEPPSGVGTGAIVAVGASSSALSVRGFAYIYGVEFRGGTNNSTFCTIALADTNAPASLVLEACKLVLRTAGSAAIQIGQSASSTNDDAHVRLVSTSLKFAAAGQRVLMGACVASMAGITIDAAGSAPTTLFNLQASCNATLLVESSDLSGVTWTNLLSAAAACASVLRFRNCKMPASFTAATGTNPGFGGPQLMLDNCDSADTNYRQWWELYAGSVKTETTIVRTGGASNGTTAVSWKMATGSTARFPTAPLASPEIARWNATTASAITVTVEVVTDNVTLNDDECWLEVHYMGSGSYPVGTLVADSKASVLATAAAQASSSVTWTTTGLTTPVKQALSVTFTPQEAGYIQAVVKLAKASTTVYVDPLLTVT